MGSSETSDSGVETDGVAVSAGQLVAALIAGVLGTVLSAFLVQSRPRGLPPQTDIVGAPIATGFDPNWRISGFVMFLGLIAIFAAVIYLLLRRLMYRPWSDHKLFEIRQVPASGGIHNSAATALRPFFTAAIAAIVLGAEWAVVTPIDSENSALQFGIASALIFAAIVLAAKLLVRVRLLAHFNDALRCIASLLAALGVLVFGVLLFTTIGMTDERVGEFINSPPLGALFVLLGMTALFFVIRSIARGQTDGGLLDQLERRSLLAIAAPMLLLLLTIYIPAGVPGTPDWFHEGERLGSAELFYQGYSPWLNFGMLHGPGRDLAPSWLGFILFQHTRWGAYASYSFIQAGFVTLTWFGLLWFLFRRNLAWLGITIVAISVISTGALAMVWHSEFGELLGLTNVHAVPVSTLALQLLCFGLLLERRTYPRLAAFTIVSVVTAVTFSEAPMLLVAILAVLVARPIVEAINRRPARESVRTVVAVAVALAIAGTLAVALLAIYGVLNDFWLTLTGALSGHELAGSHPFSVEINGADVLHTGSRIPVIVLGCAMLLFLFAFAVRVKFRAADWVALAMTTCGIILYVKFLTRGLSSHLPNGLALMIPLAAYMLYRVLEQLDLRRRLQLRVLINGIPYRAGVTTTLALTGLAVVVVPGLYTPIENTKAHFVTSARSIGREPKLGPISADPDDLKDVLDRVALIRAYAKAHDFAKVGVFDFSDSPMLYSFELGMKPVSRYFHASMAIRENQQKELIGELTKSAPEFIVWDSPVRGIKGWDAIERDVRHYLLSAWIMKNYTPFELVDGFTIFRKNPDSTPSSPASLSSTQRAVVDKVAKCSWAKIPNFLKPPAPTVQAQVSELTQLPGEGHRVFGDVKVSLKQSPVSVVATINGKVVGETGKLFQGNAPQDDSSIADWLSFTLRSAALDAGIQNDKLSYYLLADGQAQPFASGSAESKLPYTKGIQSSNGESIRVGPEVEGSIAREVAVEDYAVSGKQRSGAEWMQFVPKGKFAGGSIRVFDSNGATVPVAEFEPLPGRSEPLWVHISSCPRWVYGTSKTVEVTSPSPLQSVQVAPVRGK